MRVTENTNYNTVRETIRRTKERMENLQGQQSTLKKLNTPSDDPIGAAKVLEVRTHKVNSDQFMMNGKLAQTFLENTDHALTEIADILVRAKEIAINQSSAASTNEDSRLGVVEEVTQLFDQAVSAANRRIGERYLFGGYKTDRAPINPQGHYEGDDGKMMAEVSKDVFIAMNVPGFEAFNTHPRDSADGRKFYGPESDDPASLRSRAPASSALGENDKPGAENVNVFDELQNLRISLLTGDLSATRSTLDRLDSIHGKVIQTRAKVGSRMQGLTNSIQSMERINLTNAQLTSQLEDADMAQVVSDLAKEESVLRNALQSSQKLAQPTLLDFLK